MGEQLRRQAQAHTHLSSGEVEDIWAELVMRLTQAPGPNRLDADADTWSDSRLRKYLSTALGREVYRVAKRSLSSDGDVILDSSLDALADGVARDAVWTNTRLPDPEADVVDRMTVRELAAGIEDLAGADAARMMVADAMGASVAEQRELLGIKTRDPYRTLRDRLEAVGSTALRRVQAAVIWFVPDWAMRWFAPLASGGSLPRLSSVGITLTAVLAGGAGITTATRETRPVPPVRAVLSEPVRGTTSSRAAAPAGPAAAVQSAGAAGERITERAAAQQRARAQQAAAAERRQARRRAAARKRKAAAASSAATAEKEFGPQPITASPSGSAASAGTTRRAPAPVSGGEKSAADSEFGLGN